VRLARRRAQREGGSKVTDAGATLGRVLFYDTRLSANNTISCGSCHVQSHAFVDPNRFSKGFKGGLTDRHAMNLLGPWFFALWACVLGACGRMRTTDHGPQDGASTKD
jgi:cytochrome c peroxidase